MFFFLSKTVSYLTQPLVIVIFCFVLSILVKKVKWKKWSFGLGLGLLLFFTNDFIANEMMGWWELPATPFSKISKTYEYGILLTGVTKAEVEPSDRVHFARGADRATHTVQLYKMGFIKKVLVSGGSGRLIDIGEREADQLASALILMGVNKEDIITENTSRNTHESAIEVKKILEGKVNPDQCLLISSGYHMPRTIACFSKVGWNADAFSAEVLSHKRNFTFDALFIPKIEAMGLWQTVIREWTGMVAYRLAGYI